MPINILMPALSPTMTEGKLAKWLVKEGDSVESGDVIAEIETDKATMEVEAVDEGTIGKILVAEGTDAVAVNTLIAVLLEDGEDASAAEGASAPAAAPPASPAPAAEAPTPAAAPAPAAPAAAPAPAVASDGSRVFASPLAKRVAAQNGLDLTAIGGTGPHGRIVMRDVEAALASGTGKAAPAAATPSAAAAPQITPTSIDANMLALLPEYEAVPNSGMRNMIAKRLTASAQQTPVFYVTVDVNMDKILNLRKELNGREGATFKISVNDFVVKSTALALTRHPDVNATYTDEAILKFKRVDISMAVAIDGGLITPIIKDAASLGLASISATSKELAGKARDGKLQPHEYQGGTYSISNLGMFGIGSFTSIINPPQSSILSVGGVEQKAIVKDGALAVANMMTLTAAFDHRCIDGATAAAFMKELKDILQDPLQLML